MLLVVIVSWNVRDLLHKCLNSLVEDIDQSRIPAHILVVDNASADGSPAMVQREFPQVELIASTENLGFVRGNNLALERAGIGGPSPKPDAARNYDYVWLLNSDTEVRPGATRTLLDFMRDHPGCGLCGPKLVNPDGTLQQGAFAFPGLVQLILETAPIFWRFRGTRLDGRYPSELFDGITPFKIGHPLGAAMLARTMAISQVGILDQGYEMYAEEVDWAMRMKKAGWERWCVPAAVVVHFGGASSSQAKERTERIKWRSRMRYFFKYYAPIKRWMALQLIPSRYREDGN